MIGDGDTGNLADTNLVGVVDTIEHRCLLGMESVQVGDTVDLEPLFDTGLVEVEDTVDLERLCDMDSVAVEDTVELERLFGTNTDSVEVDDTVEFDIWHFVANRMSKVLDSNLYQVHRAYASAGHEHIQNNSNNSWDQDEKFQARILDILGNCLLHHKCNKSQVLQ